MLHNVSQGLFKLNVLEKNLAKRHWAKLDAATRNK